MDSCNRCSSQVSWLGSALTLVELLGMLLAGVSCRRLAIRFPEREGNRLAQGSGGGEESRWPVSEVKMHSQRGPPSRRLVV